MFHRHGNCFDFVAGQRSDFLKHVTEIQLEKLGLILLNETMAPSDQLLIKKQKIPMKCFELNWALVLLSL